MNKIKFKLLKIWSLKLIIPSIFHFFKILFIRTSKKKIIISLTQHLGDNIAAEPIEQLVKFNEKDEIYIIRIVGKNYQEIVQQNPNIDYTIPVTCLSEWIYLKPLLKYFYNIYDLHVDETFCETFRLKISNSNKLKMNVSNYFNYGSLLQVFCISANLPVINVKPNYLIPISCSISNLPEKYITIHAKSNVQKKEWKNEKWIKLIKHINQQYNLPVIEVGLNSELNFHYDNYHNYCGILTLNQIALIIKKSYLFIGIDSAFAHFANSFNIRRIILLGYLENFKYYNPFSGLSKNEEDQNIIHFEGSPREIPLSIVILKLEVHIKSN